MYITLRQFSEGYRWPSVSALRSIYFDATKKRNEFLPAFSKVGRRVLINPERFFQIVGGCGGQDIA